MHQLEAILDLVSDDFKRVNKLIRDSVTSKVPLVNTIGEHIINCGGKRMRPLLCLLTSRASHPDNLIRDDSITLATTIEFIHTATLLHDDVIDHATTRRGLITANEKWGNAPAVLVGDFLYSRAFQMLVEVNNMEIMHVIADATNTIAEGEVLQLAQQSNLKIREDDYFEIVYCKTAKLFEASCQIAGLVNDTSKELSTTMAEYGKNLGIAYQLVDDALDLSSNYETLGKDCLHDLAEGKITLPIIRTLKFANAHERDTIEKAIISKSSSLDVFIEIKNTVDKYSGIEYTMQLAKDYIRTAKLAAAELGNNAYSMALQQICDFVVSRKQ